MNKTIVAISRSGALRSTFRALRLHLLYNAWLNRFPRTKRIPNTQIVYRARTTESVSLALEILEGGNCYDPRLLPDGYTTFADIGCNVGYFGCWLAQYSGGRDIRGLMIDANAAVVEEARWHVRANSWRDVHVLEGVVGTKHQAGSVEFYVHEANTCSTAELAEIQLKDRHKFRKISVPVLQFGEEWQRRMGGSRCNILKIDIEGSELEFLQAETEFLVLVDVIFVEWHKYRVTFEQLDTFLSSHGFKLDRIIEDIGLNGTAFYKRSELFSSH